MEKIKHKIVPHLWFDKEAKDAAQFYASVFKVDLVTFDLLGQEFMAISAGPLFKFNESVSFVVKCDTRKRLITTGKSSAV